jgi:hypothetical protein
VNRIATLGFAVFVGMVLSACTWNNVRQIPDVQAPDSGRATVVYGLRVDVPWDSPGFGVQLDEYDMKRQTISGNCFRFNRMEASVPSVAGKTTYFEFDVKPGYYTYSAFNGAQFRDASRASRAYNVPDGAIVYIGDFILRENKTVELRQDRQAMQQALAGQAGLVDKSRLAESIEVKKPRAFLCTP